MLGCMLLAGCTSKDVDLYDVDAIALNEANKQHVNFCEAFITEFGTPAADIDWGFSTTNTTRSLYGGTRAAELNNEAIFELSGADIEALSEEAVREHTYLRGAMLGYTRRFMDQNYDAIIAFAELQDFQDRPFKQLSSGMKSRLAFSIAAQVSPDILILDEVLSVGDGAFRKKSEAKMRQIITGGTTTILVSHSLEQVRELCSKVLWLHKGRQIAFGTDVKGLCDRYQRFLDGDKTALEG